MNWHEVLKRFGGRRFRSRYKGKQETRTVVDITLGGDIVYYSGRFVRQETVIRQDKWLDWMKHAKEID